MKPVKDTIAALLVLACTFLSAAETWAHALPDHASPRVGATLSASFDRVRVWFDSALQPASSTITVQDAAGNTVDKRDGRVNPSDARLLEVGVPRLSPGTYRVIWKVAGRDGHKSTGDYTFVVK